MCRDAPTGAIALKFGVRGDITDVITRSKFYMNRFRGFGVQTPPILPFSIGLVKTGAKDVSPSIHRTQAPEITPAATQWYRPLLLHDVCSERIPFVRCLELTGALSPFFVAGDLDL